MKPSTYFLLKTYLSTVHGFVDDFKNEIGPDDMEHQKDRE